MIYIFPNVLFRIQVRVWDYPSKEVNVTPFFQSPETLLVCYKFLKKVAFFFLNFYTCKICRGNFGSPTSLKKIKIKTSIGSSDRRPDYDFNRLSCRLVDIQSFKSYFYLFIVDLSQI